MINQSPIKERVQIQNQGESTVATFSKIQIQLNLIPLDIIDFILFANIVFSGTNYETTI